jgi:mannose-6-phosphate isomerase-like protein (cupin superfamily)
VNHAPTSIETAEHYTWGSACEGWHLVRAEGLSVIEERMPPSTAERPHQHQHARQFFYVLAGELTILLDGQTLTLGTGQGLEVAPGLPHHVRNVTTADVRFLVISQPPSHGDRVEAAD